METPADVQIELEHEAMKAMLIKLAKLARASKEIVNTCRIRNHEGTPAFGHGKGNYCMKCLVASRVTLDEIVKVFKEARAL